MNQKRLIKKLVLLFVTIVVVGGVLAFPEEIGLCEYNHISCVNLYSESLAQPLVIFGLSILMSLVVLLVSSDMASITWRKFAIWGIPLGAILITLTPVSNYGACGIGIPNIDREIVTWIVSIAFLLISLIIIATKSLSRPAAK